MCSECADADDLIVQHSDNDLLRSRGTRVTEQVRNSLTLTTLSRGTTLSVVPINTKCHLCLSTT